MVTWGWGGECVTGSRGRTALTGREAPAGHELTLSDLHRQNRPTPRGRAVATPQRPPARRSSASSVPASFALRRRPAQRGAGRHSPPATGHCYGNAAAPAMSLQPAPPSRVFMELVPWANLGRENNPISALEAQPVGSRPHAAKAHPGAREVHVSGAAEVSASPDRAQVAVRVSSTKEAAAEAKKSVCRRLDYITQSLQQQGLQVSFRGWGARRVTLGPWRCFVTPVFIPGRSGCLTLPSRI